MYYTHDTDKNRYRAVTIRRADGEEWETIDRLAQLDSAPPPPREPMLVAEVEGEMRAAVSLRNGYAVADPFAPSGELVELLRARADQFREAQAVERNGHTGPLRLGWLRG
jgi:hypothetical protein